jgi:hypothetical protein
MFLPVNKGTDSVDIRVYHADPLIVGYRSTGSSIDPLDGTCAEPPARSLGAMAIWQARRLVAGRRTINRRWLAWKKRVVKKPWSGGGPKASNIARMLQTAAGACHCTCRV